MTGHDRGSAKTGETARQERAQGGQPSAHSSGDPKTSSPEDKARADEATQDNDLTTGHTTEGDGGDNDVKY